MKIRSFLVGYHSCITGQMRKAFKSVARNFIFCGMCLRSYATSFEATFKHKKGFTK